jgi:hypothetical protein
MSVASRVKPQAVPGVDVSGIGQNPLVQNALVRILHYSSVLR